MVIRMRFDNGNPRPKFLSPNTVDIVESEKWRFIMRIVSFRESPMIGRKLDDRLYVIAYGCKKLGLTMEMTEN